MVQAKQAAKRKRRKVALPVMGVAGVSLALAGGASAISKARAADMLSRDTAPPREITFDEEEIADVSLATFYVFDKEVDGILQDNTILARACGGCRGGGGGRCSAGRCGGGEMRRGPMRRRGVRGSPMRRREMRRGSMRCGTMRSRLRSRRYRLRRLQLQLLPVLGILPRRLLGWSRLRSG
jgi:hypothetical protein